MIWFTSDTHFGHGRIIGYCNRPWWRPATPADLDPRSPLRKVARCTSPNRESGLSYTADINNWRVPDVTAMEEALVERWNARVQPDDVVYHLGDFAWWRLPAEEVVRICARLNGEIRLVVGNHDRNKQSKQILPIVVKLFEWKVGGLEEDGLVLNCDGPSLTLSHYGPTAKSYPRPRFKADVWLHGHSHCHGGVVVRTGLDGEPAPVAVDMSVEGWNYAPASLEEILERVKKEKP